MREEANDRAILLAVDVRRNVANLVYKTCAVSAVSCVALMAE